MVGGPKRLVLIVEDELTIREAVSLHLSLAGFDVTEVGDGRRALEIAQATKYDVILLDVMLPTIDGVTLCRSLRSAGANLDTPVLMLTALDAESDAVVGLDSGADDYVTKPFGMRELMARVNALMRRSRQPAAQEAAPSSRRVHSHDVMLDRDRRQALVRGQAVDLTKQEFDLLYLLVGHPGIVFSRAALMAKVWAGDTYVTERTVDALVSRLRRKIERSAGDPELILTAWGSGYKFADVD